MAKSDRVRNVLRNLADILILYTKKQAVELKEKEPRSKLIVAPNSLYFKDDMWCKHSQQRDFIYVGRLIKQKKPELMIKAFIAFTENNEDSTKKAVMGALKLYLDFLLMFQYLLMLFGNRE